MFCLLGRTCVCKMKARYAQRERERERERHKEVYIYYQKCATVTNEQQQPLQKVTKSLYIVTHLGQLPFVLFT